MPDIPPYTLIRTKRRTVSMSVSFDGTLVVRAPMRTPVEFIEKWVFDKKAWVHKALTRATARPQSKKKEFVSGETFLYLGKHFPLEVRNDVTKPLVFKNQTTFVLKATKHNKAVSLFSKWYKDQARVDISQRTQAIAQRYGFSYKSIKISSATKRWGSCSIRGNLNFTWRLIMAPQSIVDYVICHELAHLRHHNHGKQFWAEVSTMYPDYKQARVWLRDHAGLLKL